MTDEWVTYRVFYYDRHSEDWLIHHCSNLRPPGHLLFFFTRLFDHGPQLIFRWKVRDAEAKGFLLEQIQQGILESPQRLVLTQTEYCQLYLPGVTVDEKGWEPDGTVVEGGYEPERERYGGPILVQEVETLFDITCRWVSSVLMHFDSWKERLLNAAQLQRILLDSLPMTDAQRADYLFGLGDTWVNYMQVPREQQVTAAHQTAEQLRSEWTSERHFLPIEYRKQVENLRAQVSTSLELKITPPDSERFRQFQTTFETDFSFPRIVVSLLHMNSNRIGVPTHVEPFLYYLLAFWYEEGVVRDDRSDRHTSVV